MALTARALGASGFILADITDSKVKETIEKVTDCWGGDFQFEMGQQWKRVVKDWRAQNGITVHLTAYGENIQTSDVMKRIRIAGKDVLVIVGSQKVPAGFFSEDRSQISMLLWEISLIRSALVWLFFLTVFLRGNLLQKLLVMQKGKSFLRLEENGS